VLVRGARPGPVRIGLFVPSYLRDDCRVEPELRRVKARDDADQEVFVNLRFDLRTGPQAYYFTVFAVQDLAISTVRRHFGVLPADEIVS
jgi:hypothetical protein